MDEEIDLDILVSYFGESEKDELQLRHTLRSIDIFGINVGRVVVAGNPPSWLSDEAVRFEVRDAMCRSSRSEKSMACVFRSFEKGVIGGHLLYCPESVVLDETMDMNDYPWYCRRDRIRSVEDHVMASRGGALITRYKMALADTRRVLERNGYGSLELTGHFLSHIDSEDLDEVRRMCMEVPTASFGYDVGCIFGNVAKERIQFKTTLAKECYSARASNMFCVEQKSRFEI